MPMSGQWSIELDDLILKWCISTGEFHVAMRCYRSDGQEEGLLRGDCIVEEPVRLLSKYIS